MDGRIEPEERFTIQLLAEDAAITLGEDEAQVFVMDSDGNIVTRLKGLVWNFTKGCLIA